MTNGGFQSAFQQLLDNTKGTVPEGAVAGVLMTSYTLNTRLPLRDESVRVLTKLWEANHKTEQVADIWKPRAVSLDGAENLKPVVVAVWTVASLIRMSWAEAEPVAIANAIAACSAALNNGRED